LSTVEATSTGAKRLDYWWTVLFIDPLAVPIARFVAVRRLLTPDQVTWISAVFGLPVGLAFAWGSRAGLVVGAVLFYVSFLFDCVDGKVARALGVTSPVGMTIDQIADGARRASASIGLAIYLWKVSQPNGADGRLFWAVAYGLLAFYFGLLSGGTRGEASLQEGSRWSQLLARHRLLPTPGAPDAAGIVFVIGPLFGWVVPCLAVGCVMLAVGTAITARRLLNR
jgi:phosphatidylglycerophosphate synthase